MDLMNADGLKLEWDVPKPICRCCLSTDRRMNNVVEYGGYFKELAGIDATQSDGLPQFVCWECGSLLQKAVRFKSKMLRAHKLLNEHLNQHTPFQMGTQDPELGKYASPQLSETKTLVFEMTECSRSGFYEELQHEKPSPRNTDFDIEVLPVESKVEVVVKTEPVLGVEYDVDITIEECCEESIEVEVEPQTTIKTPIELDPTKIKVITLNPQEQLKQREEESKSGIVFPFQCHLCYKGFNYETKLDNHMKKHSPSRGTFECELCHMFLPSAYSLSVHNLIHTRRYECMKCGKSMSDRACIVDHYRSQHEGNTYKCDVCGKISTNKKTHRSHMNRNHSTGDQPKCDQCGKSFANKDVLEEHLLIHQGVKNYECPTCGQKFRTRTQIKHHQLKHSDNKDYYCVECDVRFQSPHNLRQHLRKSMKHKDKNNFKYPCDSCDKRFETESSLRSHVQIQHEGVRGYKCPQCPAALASRNSLLKHELAVHAGHRAPLRHVCDTCGKAFRGKNVLINHVRTHTGEKPFICGVCGRGFAQRTAMHTHHKLVHMKIRKQAEVEPDPLEPKEDKEEVVPKQECGGPAPPPCDLYFHVEALP